MKKLFIVLAVFVLLAWSSPASAGVDPYYNETFTSTHSVTDYRGTPIEVSVDAAVSIRVDANFTKAKGRCLKGSVPGLELVGNGERQVYTPPTENGSPRDGYVVLAASLTPGTYTVTPFYACAATSATRVLLYATP